VPFLGVNPRSVGFKICNVTILIVLCTFVVHTEEEALQGTACSLILSCVLENKTDLPEGSTAVTELNCAAVFMVKHWIYFPNAVGLDFHCCASKQHCVILMSV